MATPNCVPWGPIGSNVCCTEDLFPYIDWTQQSSPVLSQCNCGGISGGGPTGVFRGTTTNSSKVYTTGGDFTTLAALQNEGPNTTSPMLFPTPFVGSPIFGVIATTTRAGNQPWQWRSYVSSVPQKYYVDNLREDGFRISLPVTTDVTGGATTVDPDGFRHYNYGVIIGMRRRFFCSNPPQPGYVDCDACDTTGLNTPCVPYGFFIQGIRGTVYQTVNYLKTPIGTLSFFASANSPNYGQIRSFDGVIPDGADFANRTLYACGSAQVTWWYRGSAPPPWPADDIGPRQFGFLSGFTDFRSSVCGPLLNCDSYATGTWTRLTDVEKTTMNANQYPMSNPVTGGIAASLPQQPAPW